MGDEQVFCTECGTALHGAKFCPHCGMATENATAEAELPASGNGGGAGAVAMAVPSMVEEATATMTAAAPPGEAGAATIGPPTQVESLPPEPADGQSGPPQTTAPAGRGAATGGRRPLLIGVGIGAGVAAVIAVVAIVLLVGGGGASYVSQARARLTPVIQNNNQLTGALASLSASSGSGRATAAAQTTIGAVQSAQRGLGTLNPSSGDRQFASNAKAAMASELLWLNGVVSVLSNPSSAMQSQLGGLGVEAQTKLAAIDGQVPQALASFPGSGKVIAYVQTQASAAGTKSAVSQFSGQAQALLNQSGPAYEQINQLFGQMQTAASGGVPSITLAQAESTINSVVSNRTSLAASARTLNAPTPLAASVRDALVAAYDASLKNDQSINTCLNQANTGTIAIIFQDCLSATGSDSEAATAAKQHFFALYNHLRQQIGQPAANQQF